MIKIRKTVSFCLTVMLLMTAHDAHAIAKLDFFSPVSDIMDKIGKVKVKIEDVYNTQLEALNAKIQKVAGSEGAMIFNYLRQNATSIITSAAKGQFYAADFSGEGMWNAIKGELGRYKLDYANLYTQAEQYIQARETEKIKRITAMNAEQTKLEAEYNALLERTTAKKDGEVSAEEQARLKELETGISKLKQAAAWEAEKNSKEDAEYQDMQNQIGEYQNKIREFTSKLSEDEVVNLLSKQTRDLFGKDKKDEETEELYQTALDKLFLAEEEQETPDNMERVRKIRQQEYYKAVKNTMETVVTTYSSIEEIKERSVSCADALTEQTQGLFGAAAMRICVELQNAKVAARYMEILLAQVRMETTREMQFWRDKYKLEDYDKDITKFNLDDYKLKKQTLYKKLKEKAQATAESTAKSQVNSIINKYSGF